MCHQVSATVATGSRAGAYNLKITAGTSFDRYPAEHQAVIVEWWYVYPSVRTDPVFDALITEVRSHRPLSEHVWRQLSIEESAYGSSPRPGRFSPPETRTFEMQQPAVPLLRIEF